MNDVKQVGGIWLPIHEQHMDGWMSTRMKQHPEEIVDGKFTYQYHKFLYAMKWVKTFGTAIDVGAHCGLWSMHLVKRFTMVHAFEPMALHRKCFALNVPAGKYVLHEEVAGDVAGGTVAMRTTPGSSGDTFVDPEKAGDVPMVRIDDLGIEHVDFIKLDCEGYELFALRGAQDLIRRCQPCIIVEQKPGKAQGFGLPEHGAVEFLQSLGAVLRKEIGGDFIMSWDKQVIGVDLGGTDTTAVFVKPPETIQVVGASDTDRPEGNQK